MSNKLTKDIWNNISVILINELQFIIISPFFNIFFNILYTIQSLNRTFVYSFNNGNLSPNNIIPA